MLSQIPRSPRATAIAMLVMVCAAAASGCQRTGTSADPAKPAVARNVLFISLDTVRQDVLSAYGHRPRHAPDQATSPALDQLAREGVRMADAYASSSWTLPSHMSMMTGAPPLAHGVETESAVLDPSTPTLAEILANHGYRTFGIYSAPYLDAHWGFSRGFESYTPVYGAEAAAAADKSAAVRLAIEEAAGKAEWTRYDELRRQQAESERELNDRSQTIVTSDQVTAATVARLDEMAEDGRPWFLFAHFFDAHCDYVAPPPYYARFDPDYAGTFTGERCMGSPAIGQPDPAQPGGLLRALADRDLEHAFALYEGEVAWVDDHVGTILRALDRTGMAANTLVVVVSDHGEEFFEHGGLGHRRTLYEEVVRTPMILRLPDVLPAGRTVPGPVSVTDLLPTILDVLGLPFAPGPGSTSFFPELRSGKAVDHAVLLRTIMMFSGAVQVDAGDPITLRQVVVRDAYRRGSIKVARMRSWPQFGAGLAPDVTAILQQEAAKQYGRERLRWIDLERHPDEPEASFSSDFSDRAASAALAEFRREYEAALAHRPPQQRTSALPHNVRSKLESLGYIERSTGPSFPEPDVVLPPPLEHETAN